jgi:hypothetical protein
VHTIRVRLGPERATHLSLVTPRPAAVRAGALRAAVYVVVSQLQSNVAEPLHVHHTTFKRALEERCRPVQASEQLVRHLKAVGAVPLRVGGAALISISSAKLLCKHLALPTQVTASLAAMCAASVVEVGEVGEEGEQQQQQQPPSAAAAAAAAAALAVLPEQIPSSSYATPQQLACHYYGLNSIKGEQAKKWAMAKLVVDLVDYKR